MTLYQNQGTFGQRAKRFMTQCWRVLKITKKPDKQEFTMLVKVSGLGIAVVGLIGFILFMFWRYAFPV